VRFWRISEYEALDGAGGLITDGRWHRRGRPVVYMADSSALAMLEVLVHLEVATVPRSFQLLAIEVSDTLTVDRPPPGLAASDLSLCLEWGEGWLGEARTAIACVPSAIAPDGFNWLLNPLHRESASVHVVKATRWPWDERLFARGA
jgi:RES domain-containing protein